MNSTIAIFSSARKNGNTDKLLQQLNKQWPMEIIDLDSLTIGAYNYENDYRSDDFHPLIDRMLLSENILFVSPVYWSGVTSPMKTFIDRTTELLDIPELKSKAKLLKNKKAYVVTTSANDKVSPTFSSFFSSVFNYFEMKFAGLLHVNYRDGHSELNNERNISKFLESHQIAVKKETNGNEND